MPPSAPERPPLVSRAEELARELAVGSRCEPGVGAFLHLLAAQRGRSRVAAADVGVVGVAWLVSALQPTVAFVAAERREGERAALARLVAEDEQATVAGTAAALEREAPFDLVVDGSDGDVPVAALLAPGGTVVSFSPLETNPLLRAVAVDVSGTALSVAVRVR